MKPRRVVVTGLGALTPIGNSLESSDLTEFKISNGNRILFSKLPPYLSLRLLEIGDKN